MNPISAWTMQSGQPLITRFILVDRRNHNNHFSSNWRWNSLWFCNSSGLSVAKPITKPILSYFCLSFLVSQSFRWYYDQILKGVHLSNISGRLSLILGDISYSSFITSIYFKKHASNGCMMTSSKGNIFRVTGHLCGEFTGHRWIPHRKASNTELWWFLWSAPE